MITYKIKGVSLCKDEHGFNYIKVKLVERFIDGKYDKFISLTEGVDIINGAVIDVDKKDSVMSKAEIKAKKKSSTKPLFSEILDELEDIY